MAKHRLIPPASTSVVRHNMVVTGPSGLVYNGSTSAFVDAESQDSHILQANGWTNVCQSRGEVGPTSSRPVSNANTGALSIGLQYMDTTLGFIVVWNGANWIRPDTGVAA